MASILLIEDDITFSGMLRRFLVNKKFEISVKHSGAEGLALFKTQPFDLVLLDYRLPDGVGMDFLHDIRKIAQSVPIIIMTSFDDVRTAVKAIQAGAIDYILKPVNPDELLITLNRALTTKPNQRLEASNQFIEGTTPASKKLYEYVRLVAPTSMSVIIEGESGTGKERVAKMIHQLSPRANAPFIAVDCGAISESLAASELFGHVKGSFTGAVADSIGRFEAANSGTLFLDEVGNLSYDVQVKLLRAIQEKVIYKVGSNRPVNIDVRIITATNEDLAKCVKQGNFREDLFHRLNEFSIKVPALRERGEDLFQFASLFRKLANTELNREASEFSLEVNEIFKKYSWPGNLRELKNVIRRAVLFTTGSIISIESLPNEMHAQANGIVLKRELNVDPIYDLRILQESQEKELISKTLHEVGFNKSKAARMLNIDRKTLYAKIEKYKLE